MKQYVAGVDLGTTGIKAVLFDETGTPVAQAQREASCAFPRPGWAEQDPAAWYEIPCELRREVTEGIDRDAVCAVGLSSQGISFVPVDGENRPLSVGISWLDARAEAEARRLSECFGAETLFRRTGKPVNPVYTLPKLLWLREHDRALFDAADAFLMPMDYFLARAAGKRWTDPTMAGGTMLLDLETGAWAEDLAEETGIPVSKLPRVMPVGTSAGPLNGETRERTGLRYAIAAVGAQDQKIAAYGARLSPGTATLSLGTAGALEVLSGRRSDTLPAFRYADGRQMCLEGCVDTFGAAIRWVRETVFPDLSYREMDDLAAGAEPGCGGVRFRARLLRPEERGGWTGLSLAAGRGEMIRAVYEGLAAEVRALLDEARRAGSTVEELRVFGGASRSEIVCRILAEICGVDVLAVKMGEVAALGAALAAYEAAGGDGSAFGTDLGVTRYAPGNRERGDRIYEAYRQG